MRPYALAGAGALVFNPTVDAKRMNSAIDRQNKAAFVSGVNLDITSNFGVRGEYRGLVYEVADFQLDALNLDKVTHLAHEMSLLTNQHFLTAPSLL